jgi:hypothetical protein
MPLPPLSLQLRVLDQPRSPCAVSVNPAFFSSSSAPPAYFEVARSEVESHYVSRPTQFAVGDFAGMAPTLADADFVTPERFRIRDPKDCRIDQGSRYAFLASVIVSGRA